MDKEKSDNSSPLPGTGAASQPGPTTPTPGSQSAASATPAPHPLLTLPQRIDGLLAEIQPNYAIADMTDQMFGNRISRAKQLANDASVSKADKLASLKLINEVIQKLEALLEKEPVTNLIRTAFETEQSTQSQLATEANTDEAMGSYLASRDAMGGMFAEASALHRQAYAGTSPFSKVNASRAELETSLNQAQSQRIRTQQQLTQAEKALEDANQYLELFNVLQDFNAPSWKELDHMVDAAVNAKMRCEDLLNQLCELSESLEQGAAPDRAQERQYKKIMQSLERIDTQVADLRQELNDWRLIGQAPEVGHSATGLPCSMEMEDNIPDGHVPPAHGNADAFGMLDETDPVANLPGESTRIVGSDPGVDHP